MKKILFISAILAVALAFVSCDKKGKKVPVTYETPKYQSLAAKYDVAGVSELALNSFEITPSGLWVMVGGNLNANEVKSGKIGEPVEQGAGKILVPLSGYGKVLIAPRNATPTSKADNGGFTLTFTPDETNIPITVNATPVEPTVGASASLLALAVRTWEISATEVSVKGGDLPANGVSKTWEGRDASDIVVIMKDLKRLSNDKINVKESDIAGYNVLDITVTDASFIVRFTEKPTFSSSLDYLDKDLKFKYEVDGKDLNNPIFNGVAEGQIVFDELKNCSIVLSAKVDASNENYEGKVIFYLKEKANL